MAERRVLLFDGNKIEALYWRAGHIAHEGSFGGDPVGLESFQAYVQSKHKSLFYLLADLGEEGFQLESIPFLGGSDRTSLIKRRLGQYFYGTPLATAITLGRETEGRRDEKVLFAALTRPDAFTPWLDALRQAEVALVGIFTLPLILSKSAAFFAGKRERCLLLTVSNGGLRQTYFVGGQMHFSRLTQLTSTEARDIATACKLEASKTLQYLVSQRQLKRGNGLPTVILAATDSTETLRELCLDSDEVSFEVIDQSQLAHTAGLKSRMEGVRADWLFIHLLFVQTPPRQFAPSVERRHYRLWQTRFALHATAAAIVLGALVLGGRMVLQGFGLGQHTAELQQQTMADSQRYQGLLESLPKIELTPDQLRGVISGVDTLQKRGSQWEPLLIHLSKGLDAYPAIELKQLSYGLGTHFDTKVGAGGTATAPRAGVPGLAKSEAWAVMEIVGHLPAVMASDQRAMIELLDRFAADLRHDAVEIVLSKRPVDVESAKSFKSGQGKADALPEFTLRLGKPVLTP
jgi:hypothetical protein